MAVEPKRATTATKKPATRRRTARRKPASKAIAKRETKVTGEARVDALVQNLNAHLNVDLEPTEDSTR